MLTIALFNQKGGVGKTSIACNLAAAFAAKGLQTLLVDLDAQSNATQYISGDHPPSGRRTVSDFFEGSLGLGLFSSGIREMVSTTPIRNLSLIPADGRLIELQTKLEARYKVFKLRDALVDLSERVQVDIAIIDCPPALNFYSMSALMAADRIYIPFDCDAFAVNGLRDVCNIVQEIREDHNSKLEISGVIANQVLTGARQPTQAIKAVEELGLRVIKPYLSSSVVMRESHDAREPLISFRPKHKLAREFVQLATAILHPNEKKTPDRSRAPHDENSTKVQTKNINV